MTDLDCEQRVGEEILERQRVAERGREDVAAFETVDHEGDLWGLGRRLLTWRLRCNPMTPRSFCHVPVGGCV